MGCEASIEFSRFYGGEFPRNAAFFNVCDPVIIVPRHRDTRGEWANFRARGGIEDDLRMVSPTYVYVCANEPVGSDSARLPAIGLAIIHRTQAVRCGWIKKWSEPPCKGPGGIPLETLEAAWARLAPGIWVVTVYHESGCEYNRLYYLRSPDTKFDLKVEYEIWT